MGDSIIEVMRYHKIPKNVKVIREGDEGAHMYIIAEGEFEMTSTAPSLDDEKKESESVTRLTVGQSFGDLALMHTTNRDFTIRSVGKSNVIYSIDRIAFRSILASAARAELNNIVEFLKGVKYLQPLEESDLIKMAERINEEEFKKDEQIITLDNVPDSLFIVTEGSVCLT